MHTRHAALSIALVLFVAAVAPATAATAPVDADAVGDISVTASPASSTASSAVETASRSDAPDSIIASSDVAIVRLNVSGVPAEADDDGTLLGDELELSLQQTAASTPTNASAKTLDASADADGVAVKATENAVYVGVDLATATFQRGNETATAGIGDSFTAIATVTDAVTDGENDTRQTTIGVVEPSVRVTDDVTDATAGDTVDYEVATTLAPGSSLTVSLSPGQDAESDTETVQATVDENSRATAQLSFDAYEANEEYSVTVTADSANVTETVTGTTTAPETATADATGTTTGESTETSTTAPGFGVVAALLALIGAGALGRRE